MTHKTCHEIQTTLVEYGFNDFTKLEKVTFLIDDITCNTFDTAITTINANSSHCKNYEDSQFHLSENIRMVMERSHLTGLNVAAI